MTAIGEIDQNHGSYPSKHIFPHFPWSSYLKMTVSQKLSVKSTKTMGAIVQNESPEAKTMGAIVQKGQNHGSYRSKRSPRGHLDEAPMEMGLP